MAYLGGGFTSAVAAAGNAILSGKELQVRDDEIQLQKQQIAMGQIAMQNAQRQQQTQATVGAFLSSEAQKDASAFTDPAKSAQLYEKAAGLALQGGDFVSANEMGELAKGKMNEAKEQLVVAAQQKHQKQEDLATTADDYSTNPTPEGAKDLMRKAIDAGVNPTSIPMPGTPQWATWVNAQKQAGMDSKSRADLAQKAYDANANRELRLQEHADSVALRQQSMQQTAMLRESMLGIAQERLDLEKQKASAPPKQTAQMQQTNNAVVASASEAVRGLRVIGKMSSTASSSPFAGLNDGTILDTVAKTGTNAATPEGMQMYNVAAQGLGLEVSRVLTLGAGRGANQATINEMQKIVEGHAGDSNATLLFKYANAADIVKNRLASLPDSTDPHVQASRKEAEDILGKIPSPEQVLDTVKNPKVRQQMLNSQAAMADVAQRVVNESQGAGGGAVGLPGAADTGAGTTAPPLPSGWSVKEH